MSKNILGPKTIVPQKFFVKKTGTGKFLGPKTLWVQVQKKFGSKIFWSKKNLDQKNFGPKFFKLKISGLQKIWS